MQLRRLTPEGVGGVALVGLEGPGAAAALARLIDRPLPAVGRVRLAGLQTPEGEAIDEVLIARAGEEAFELGCHGGPAVVSAVTALLRRVGARPWAPAVATAPAGERVAVEVDAWLPRATTELAAQVLLAQRDAWAAALAELGSLLRSDRERAQVALERLLASARFGLALLTPPRVVLCGPVNAGKSSLLNALVDRTRVLVSETPGTTRDAIEEPAELLGLPVRLIDTAGLRASDDAIEAEGIARAERLAADADARLAVVDLSAPEAGLALARALPAPCLVVGNKRDLVSGAAGATDLAVSATRQEGLDALRRALRDLLVGPDPEGAVVFTDRQAGLVRGAWRACERRDLARAAVCLSAIAG